MFIEYRPEGQPTQTFEWNPGRVRLGESAAIETTYSKLAGEGKTIQEFLNDIRQGSALARRVLLHRLLRKQAPTLRFDDFDPYEDEVKVTLNKAELLEARTMIERTKAIPEAQKQQALTKIDEDIADAPESGNPGKSTGSSTVEISPSETSGSTTS